MENVRFEAGLPPVTPSIIKSDAPVGPCRMIPMSVGNEWLKSFRVTDTLPACEEIIPSNPETIMDDGYGDAFPKIGKCIWAAFVNKFAFKPGSEETELGI